VPFLDKAAPMKIPQITAKAKNIGKRIWKRLFFGFWFSMYGI